jgi:hypothetical protein
MRVSKPISVARFNSVSVIASGFVKLLFRSAIAVCRSPSPNESMICSVPGVGEADGVTDLTGTAGLLAVGTDDGAGLWPKAFAANKSEMAVTTARFNIAFIVSWSPR